MRTDVDGPPLLILVPICVSFLPVILMACLRGFDSVRVLFGASGGVLPARSNRIVAGAGSVSFTT